MSGKSNGIVELQFKLEHLPSEHQNRVLHEVQHLAEVRTNRHQRPHISQKGNLIITVDLGNLEPDDRRAALNKINEAIDTLIVKQRYGHVARSR